MLEFETPRLRVRSVGKAEDPAEYLPLLNSDPQFVDASTLHTGVRAWDVEDAERFLWQAAVMEDSYCLGARTPQGRLAAAMTLLVPHPREQQPWIGLLLVAPDLDRDDWGGEFVAGVEAELARSGWTSLFVSPLVELEASAAFWQRRGYRPVEERLDNDKRRVLVCRRPLPPLGG